MTEGALTLGVVVPTLDEAAALPGLLERLAEAREQGELHDLVVADGGSADGTAKLARSAGVPVVRTRRGRGVQLAAGAATLETDLLLFLHADVRPEPGALAGVARAFADPSVVATGMRQRIDAPERIYRWIERASDARVRRFGWVYGDSGLAARRSAYEQVGGFAPIPVFEDLDLSRRLARVGRVRLVDEARLVVSARRWKRVGVLRCTARNWMLTGAYWLGVSPQRLDRFYPRGERAAASREIPDAS